MTLCLLFLNDKLFNHTEVVKCLIHLLAQPAIDVNGMTHSPIKEYIRKILDKSKYRNCGNSGVPVISL